MTEDYIPPEPEEQEPVDEEALSQRLRNVYDAALASGEIAEDGEDESV